MARGDHTFAISVIASAAVHAALAASVLLRDEAPRGVALAKTQAAASIYIRDQRDESEEFGTHDGAGVAANASPGDVPMAGRAGDQVQAFLSRDPVGPGSVGNDPSMSVLPKTPQVVQPVVEAEAMIGAAPRAAELVAPKRVKHGNDDTTLERTKDSPQAVSPEAQAAVAGGSTADPADPAIMSDSESDPFASSPHVEFQDGRVDVRLGRKVKTVRPKLNLAARYDLMASGTTGMKVRVTIDDEGAVRNVEILQSSKSEAADQAVKVALYQWWIEPKRDKGSRVIDRVVTFSIGWR